MHEREAGSEAPRSLPLRSRQENGNSTILAQAIYYRVAGSSEPTSYTWTFSPAESGAGGIAAYRGVNNSTPIDTSGFRSFSRRILPRAL